jgi:hypothetical protein
VKPAARWPLHPAPREGEALSSWLQRVAARYQMDLYDLLEHDLGHGRVDDLDTAPPPALLTALSLRSGIELERLRCMSFAGWVPWLLDSLDSRIPDALETYAFQFSLLLPRRGRKTRSITSWRAWLPSQPIHRACPLCLNDSEDQAILLAWKLPLMLSCPQHGCWLESYSGVPGQFLGWENADAAPRTASDAMVAMDRRTWQALTTGYVELPRRRIHAGLWFRLLRTLLDEALGGDEVVVIEGDAGIAAAFSALPFDHLIFTGSTAVGRLVMAAAAPQLTPLTLELGGKSPCLIAPDMPLRAGAHFVDLLTKE